MRTYLRLLDYVLPYWRKVVLLFITVALFASLSGVSLTLIHPFLRIIIYDNTPQVERVEHGQGGVQGIPLPAGVETVRSRAQNWFEARMYAGGRASRLSRFCVVLLLLFLLKNVFGYLQTYLTVYLEQKVLYRIRNDVYGHLQKLPLSFFEREKTGHIISRITNDVSMLRGAVVGAAASMIRNGLMMLIALMVVLAVSWKLSLLTFVVIPLNLVLIGFIGSKLRKRSFRTQAGMADLTSLLEENVSGMRVVKAFNMGDYEQRRFGEFNLKYMRQFLKMKLWGAVASPTSELLGTLSIVAILWYGGMQVINGAITPENLVLFVGAMIWVVTPVKNMSKLNNVIQESVACAERVFAILDIPREPLGAARGRAPATFEREI
ncbi:MAG: ABC transporter transmembrane domain-containing protein, partial [Candidatus Krumholzibacteria bacterium]